MKQKVIVIAGPTGVGKTASSIALAKAFQGEIISGDSMQVYQELSIGTAKIKPEEMNGVTHHLVDCMSFQSPYNVKMFQEIARKTMDEMISRNQQPIVCGGTGLYIKSLLYDYEFLEQERDEEFVKFLDCLSNEQLYSLLMHVDKEALSTIHKNNRQRLIRALEMAHDGKKKSDVIAQQDHTMLYDAYCIGLTCDRDVLYERINKRVDVMMEDGLLKEITDLYEIHKDAMWDFQSMQSIGYKEWIDYFNQDATIEECVDRIKKNSRNFAKRQYTWFENQMPMHWYDVCDKAWLEDIIHDIEEWLQG